MSNRLAFIGQREYFACHVDCASAGAVKFFHFDFGAEDDLISAVTKFNPQYTFVFRGEFPSLGTTAKLPGIRIAISTEPMPKLVDGQLQFTSDSLGRFKKFLGTFDRCYDYVFHYDDTSDPFFRSMGVRVSGYLTLPIDVRTFRRIETRKTRGVAFLGRSTAYRERLLGPLKRDFDVLHLAHGWIGQSQHDVESMLHLLSSFKVVLNIHAEPEISWEPRVQQMLSAGSLVVSERISPNRILEPDKHYVEVGSPQHLYETCKRILNERDAFECIAQEGMAVVRTRLNAANYWHRLVEGIESGSVKRASVNRDLLDLSPLEAGAKYDGFAHLADYVLSRHV